MTHRSDRDVLISSRRCAPCQGCNGAVLSRLAAGLRVRLPYEISGAFVPAPWLDRYGAEEVLQIDARAHEQRGRQHVLQVGALRVVRVRIGGGEEDAPIQKMSLCEIAPADHHRRIRRVVEFRARLRRVHGALPHVPEHHLGGLDVRGEHNAVAASAPGVAAERALHLALHAQIAPAARP